ncbi:HAMP domain-containing sensor histidine kinase [uncultured Thiodictyon sp.]|uniref:sensor histidine kinase n=1 Tax=uncultured Thiodictyon sp. TaxID=1846217 RepID=UPI0025CD2375|nr:HAMP domain-containing sensor histidine kinase [uncultured Thiodictyon sp.]
MADPTHLLLLDHDLSIRQRYATILQEEGCVCESVLTCQELLWRLGHPGIDGVIASSMAPGLEGLDLAGAPGPAPCLLLFSLTPASGAQREPCRPASCLWLRQPVTDKQFRIALEMVFSTAANVGERPHLDEAAVLAHEFRSPLASLRTTAETLHKGYYGALSPSQQTAIESIERNSGYLQDTINCVGHMYELENKPIAVVAEAVELVTEVVAPILGRPEYRDNRTGMRLTLHAPEPLRVTGHRGLLRIVVKNLINNAIKYGHRDTEIQIRIEQAGRQALLSVRNEGIGIPAADLGRLFQRFGRLRLPGSEGIKGSGLGLYLCRRIVELFGGTIVVQSQAGKYAEFRVFLNRAR